MQFAAASGGEKQTPLPAGVRKPGESVSERTARVIAKFEAQRGRVLVTDYGTKLWRLAGPIGHAFQMGAGLFRSARPNFYDTTVIARLKELGVRHVVDARSKVDTAETEILAQNGIRYHHYHPLQFSPRPDWNSFKTLVQNSPQEPLWIHCEHGQVLTGVASIVARKAQGHSALDIKTRRNAANIQNLNQILVANITREAKALGPKGNLDDAIIEGAFGLTD